MIINSNISNANNANTTTTTTTNNNNNKRAPARAPRPACGGAPGSPPGHRRSPTPIT